jgi:tetratricopeptide (TPR) repeat protein
MIASICSLVLICAVAIPAQRAGDLAAADDLIARRKYASAFRLLDEKDPRNQDVAFLEKKIRLAMNFSAATVMHRSFTFVDLENGQQLADYRESPEVFNPYIAYDFQVDSILESLIKKTPDNPVPYRLLGNYYFRINRQYGDEWFVTGNELMRRAGESFARADRGKTLGRVDLEEYALVSVYHKDFRKAVALYERVLADDPGYANANYGVAYAYHMSGNNERAFEYALRALDGFKDAYGRADASVLAALSAEALDGPADALIYYRKSREFGRSDFFNAKKILYYSLLLEDEQRWFEEAGALLDLDPHNLEYYYELLDCFAARDRAKSIEAFLDQYERKHRKDGRTLGNIFLLKSVYYKKIANDPARRKRALSRAYAEFKRIFSESDEFMLMIKKELEGID